MRRDPTDLAPTPDPRAYVWDQAALRAGHQVDLLIGGSETFPRIIAAITAARRSVLIEIYILRGDDVGRAIGDALCERARAGVPCYLLYDDVGSMAVDSVFLDDLANAGVQVLAYHPIGPFRRRFHLGRISRRNHRKLVVVDGQVGFVGGLNFGEEYTAARHGGDGWHDVHARVVGPVCRELEASFRAVWESAGGDALRPLARIPTANAAPGTLAVAVLENQDLAGRMAIRRAYLHAIAQARDEVLIENAYFIPDMGVRWALRRAVKRGVSVKVIVPSVSDLPVVMWASQHLFTRLLEHGVRIFTWPGRMMHAKAAVVDGAWVTVGSYNLDYVSLMYNLELNLAIADPTFGAHVAEVFTEHVAASQEITLATWKRRPAWQKVREWFFYRFKRWL